MATYSGFSATDQRASVKTWYWRKDGTVNSRIKGSITVYNPVTQSGTQAIDMVYVPGLPAVRNGNFFMKLSDLRARTGNDAKDDKAAQTALQNSSTVWQSNFDAWRPNGTLYNVPASIDGRPNPTPNTQTYYDDKGVALMWSLITHKIKDIRDSQNVFEARFWTPVVTNNTPYQIYLKVNSDSDTLVQTVQDAVTAVLKKLDEKGSLYKVTVTKSVDGLGVNQIGHNFFNLYDTYMTDTEYKRMLNSVYTDRSAAGFDATKDPMPIRPWPDLPTATVADKLLDRMKKKKKVKRAREKVTETTITLAKIKNSAKTGDKPSRSQNRVMNNVGAKELADKFWPNAVYTNKKIGLAAFYEWLHRTGHGLGGKDVQKNLCFGTSESNTHMIRAEELIKRFARSTGWKGRLVTIANDHAHDKRPMWQVDPNPKDHEGAPTFVKTPTTGGKPYVWAVAFLDYIFFIDEPATKGSNGMKYSFADVFDVFNRYAPLLLEYKVDTATLTTVLKLLAPTASTSTKATTSKKSALRHNPFSVDHVTAAFNTLDLDDEPEGAEDATNLITASQFSSLLSHRLLKAMASSSLEKEETIKLFGSTISVDLYKYTGTVPDGVTPPAGTSALYEQVELSTLKLSDLISELAGTPFDSLSVKNALFVYQNCQIDSTKPVGWSFSCDVTISKDVGSIHTVSHTLLGTDDFTVHVSADFGNNADQTWKKALILPSFTLTGTISSLSSVTVANATLTSIGIHLHATRAHYDASAAAKLHYYWDIFGQMAITMPGSSTASSFDFCLSEQSSYVLIHGALRGDIWKDAAGIKRLNLQSVCVDIGFDLTSTKPSTFDIEIDAQLELNSSLVEVNGMYSSGEVSLSATWASFDLTDLGELFHYLEDKTFNFPTVDVAIDTATLTISSKDGVSVALTDVIIDGIYDITEASVSLGPSGVDIRADYEGAISIGDIVTLNKVKVALSLSTGGQTSYFWLDGQVSREVLSNNLTFDVQVYFSSGSQYVVYGCVTGTNSWTFGNLLKDSCPEVLKNVGLTSLSILVASANITDTGPVSVPFDIRPGLQICANVGDVTQIDGVLKNSGSSSVSGIRLYFHLPNPTFMIELPSSLTSACVDLGHNIKTGPVDFIVATSPPTFLVKAELTYQPGSEGTKLKFDFTLKLGTTSAAATLKCDMRWENPLGICSRLTITSVALGVDIDYAGLINVELAGKFDVGDTKDNGVVLVFGEDVSDLLIKVDLSNIDVNDIIRLTSKVLNITLPTLPNGTIICKSFDLYACPKGVWFGSDYYAAGFSATLNLGIFGVNAYASFRIDTSSGFSCSASIDNFHWSIGILSLWVTDASLRAKWTSSDKYVYATGKADTQVLWWTVSVSVWIKITTSGISAGTRSFARAPSAISASVDSLTDIETIFTFPTFGSHPLPITMRKNVPPTDWQNPMSGGPGIVLTFKGEFDSALLSDVADRTTHHLRVIHALSTTGAGSETAFGRFQDVLASLNGGRGSAGPHDAANWCNQIYIAAQNARETQCEQLRAEYRRYAAELARLAEVRARAAERHRTAMEAAEQEQEVLRQREQEVRAAAEVAKKASADKLKAATGDLVTHERYLRRQIGDPAEDLKDITAAIASVTSELTAVNTALRSIPSANLPWIISGRRHLENLSSELRQQRAVLEASQTLALQRQHELSSNLYDPMYQRVREAEARLAALQLEEQSLASSLVQEANTISTAIVNATSHLEWTQSHGDTLRQWRDAQRAVEAHVASRSPFFDEHGRLVNLEDLPESVACEAAHRNLCLAIDAAAGITSVEKTIQMFHEIDQQQRSRVAAAIDALVRRHPTNLIQLHKVTLKGTLHRPDDRLEKLVLTAHATGVIGASNFSHHVEMPIVDHNAFVHGLAKKLLADMF